MDAGIACLVNVQSNFMSTFGGGAGRATNTACPFFSKHCPAKLSHANAAAMDDTMAQMKIELMFAILLCSCFFCYWLCAEIAHGLIEKLGNK